MASETNSMRRTAFLRRSAFLRRTRHRVWAAIGLCLIARTADAALGLHLIEPMDAGTAQEAPREPNAKDIQP